MDKYDIILDKVEEFKSKYGNTVAFRYMAHSKVVAKHLNPDEEVLYAFCGQKNNNPFDVITSCVVVLTNKRILIGQKRLFFGYFLTSITPDLFNDLKAISGIIWGRISIDTMNELTIISNLSKKSLIEIETNITSFMMDKKKHIRS